MDRKTVKSTVSHIETKQNIEYIEKLFKSENITINESSFLYLLLQEVKTNFSHENNMILMFKALFVDRIYNALKHLDEVSNKKKFLKDLLKGSLDFFKHKHSHSKNILWELEVFSRLKKDFDNVSLNEPDIVIKFENDKIGIACKKIYSENATQKILSKAVKQIESNSFEFGIVAINIDCLLPEGKILSTNSAEKIMNTLNKYNKEYIANNEQYFLKYLNKSRIIALIVSSEVIVEIDGGNPPLNNAFQWTIWTIPNLKKRHKEIMDIFRQIAN